MQKLEGDETAVDKAYARIQRYPRHTDLNLIDCAPIQSRTFDRWSMGFRRLGATDWLALQPAFPTLAQS